MLFNIKGSNRQRIIVGSVLGIGFFSIWQFFKYYANLYEWEEGEKNVFLYSSIIACVLLSYVLIKIKYQEIVTAISFILFVIIMVITYSYDVEIKNHIAIYAGYFSTNSKPDYKEGHENNNIFKHPLASYSVSVPENWVLRNDKGELFPYYLLIYNNIVQTELRPKCYSYNTAVFTDVVTYIKSKVSDEGFRVETTCGNIDDKIYYCKIIGYDEKGLSRRLNWTGFKSGINMGADLAFINNSDNNAYLQDANKIISSLEFSSSNVDSSISCLGISDWF